MYREMFRTRNDRGAAILLGTSSQNDRNAKEIV
jgi:hypothetical protein